MPSTHPDRDRLRHLLSEREKELDALYQLAALFSRPVEDVREVVKQTATILQESMQYPAIARVEIDADGYQAASGASGPTVDAYRAHRTYSIEKQVRVEVSYCGAPSDDPRDRVIDERERRLIGSTADLMGDLLQRQEMDQVLRQSTATLGRQAAELENKNIALREVLSQIEQEKRALLRDARAHIDLYIRPYLHDIAERHDADDWISSRVTQIETSLELLFTEDDRKLVALADRLSPREAEICGLIRNGLTSKEISGFLHISEATVERHRNTIRKKLDLNRTTINLTSFLRSMT
jgi:DNA-binding CsgD family transcriptional regulator